MYEIRLIAKMKWANCVRCFGLCVGLLLIQSMFSCKDTIMMHCMHYMHMTHIFNMNLPSTRLDLGLAIMVLFCNISVLISPKQPWHILNGVWKWSFVSSSTRVPFTCNQCKWSLIHKVIFHRSQICGDIYALLQLFQVGR